MMSLARHFAHLVGWTSMMIDTGQLDLAPGGEPMAPPPQTASTSCWTRLTRMSQKRARPSLAPAMAADAAVDVAA